MEKEREIVRAMLYKNSLSHTWLINRLEEKGVSIDSTNLSSILRGRRKGNKAHLILNEALIILQHYEEVAMNIVS